MKARSQPDNPSDWSNFYTPERFQKTGDSVVKTLSAHLSKAQSRGFERVLPLGSPNERLDYWSARLCKPHVPEARLWTDDLLQELLDRSNQLHDPRYAGHQVAVPFPELAWLQAATALINNGMAIDEMGPASSPMEEAVMRAIAEFMDLGEGAGGILCHGGTLANLTALLAARQRIVPDDVWKKGGAQPCAVLVSDQAHYCVDRAVRVMGWGEAGVVQVETDSQHSIRPEALEEAFERATSAGRRVVAVVGNACTTSTGTFDDLNALADFAEGKKIWFHVDGAHGAAQIFSHRHRAVLKGMERADSVAMDFHKMLGIPALCTGLFYRNGTDAYAAFSQEAAYLYESEDPEWWNFSKRTFECTKRMLSAAVYGIWEAHGPALWESLVDRLVDRAQTAYHLVSVRPQWEAFARPQSNIFCFRLKNRDNALLRSRFIEQCPHYIVKTVLGGETWLRCTFQNPLTDDEDIRSLLDGLEALAKKEGC